MARPLLKTNEKSTLTRPPGVEAKIDAALTQDWTTLSRLARVSDPRSPDFLPSECLVHLIRDAIRRGEDRISSVLMSRLLNRAGANLLRTVPDSRMRDAEAVRQEILSSLALMFAEDGLEGHEDELDFYECKFLRSLSFLRIDHVRKENARRKELTDLSEVTTEDGDVMLEEDLLARLSRKARIGASQEDHAYLPEVIKALDRLPPDQKRTVVLRRIIGHTEEQTAKICNVDMRTIRNRLARADMQLKKLKEDL